MFAMNGKKQRSSFALAGAKAGGTVAVPAFFGKIFHLVDRLAKGKVEIPKHAGLVGLALLFGATGLYGMALGGLAPAVLQETTSRLGFGIGEIKISGHRETSEIDVLEQLELDGSTSLIGFDSEAARQRIMAMPWVRQVEVTKLYPDGISVKIAEKQAFAVWQKGDEVTMIDEDGKPISVFDDEKYIGLPLVIGESANLNAKSLVAMMAGFPGLASQVKAYVNVGGRRWDLRLQQGTVIQLPAENAELALSDIVRLDSEQGLMARDIVALDMRLDDRIAVRLTPDAQAVRDAGLKAVEKKAKKPGAHI